MEKKVRVCVCVCVCVSVCVCVCVCVKVFINSVLLIIKTSLNNGSRSFTAPDNRMRLLVTVAQLVTTETQSRCFWVRVQPAPPRCWYSVRSKQLSFVRMHMYYTHTYTHTHTHTQRFVFCGSLYREPPLEIRIMVVVSRYLFVLQNDI